MQKLNYLLFFVLVAVVFAGILPYPILSNHTGLTEGQALEINNANESEVRQKSSSQRRILSLSFADINSLLPVGSTFELLDVESEEVFSFVRTGGENHADIEPETEAEFDELMETVEFSWARRPALVKLNETAFLPASWAAYPHGYSKTNTCFGHFCLHFLHSKTDGTGEEDFFHQRAVKKAAALASEVLERVDF